VVAGPGPLQVEDAVHTQMPGVAVVIGLDGQEAAVVEGEDGVVGVLGALDPGQGSARQAGEDGADRLVGVLVAIVVTGTVRTVRRGRRTAVAPAAQETA